MRTKIGLAKANKHRSYVIPKAEIEEASTFAEQLWRQKNEFEYADLMSCMVMNYQAAILHSQQHAAASLALGVSVMESLVHEVFLSYGLVGSRSAKPYATRSH